MNFFGFGKRPPSSSPASTPRDFDFNGLNFLTVGVRLSREQEPTILVNNRGEYLPKQPPISARRRRSKLLMSRLNLL